MLLYVCIILCYALLFNCYNTDITRKNLFQGLTALSEAILVDNDRTANALVLAVPDLNIPVPNEQNSETSNALLVDFAGWTSLTWLFCKWRLIL